MTATQDDICDLFRRNTLPYDQNFSANVDVIAMLDEARRAGRQPDYLKLCRLYSDFIMATPSYIATKRLMDELVRERLTFQNEHLKKSRQALFDIDRELAEKEPSLVKAETRLKDLFRSGSPVLQEKQQELVSRQKENITKLREKRGTQSFVFEKDEELQKHKAIIDGIKEALKHIEHSLRGRNGNG